MKPLLNWVLKQVPAVKSFGSITSLQLSRAIRDQRGYDIDRKKISIPEDVKELGSYKATIDFGNGKSTEAKLK